MTRKSTRGVKTMPSEERVVATETGESPDKTVGEVRPRFRLGLGELAAALEQGRARVDRAEAALREMAAHAPTFTELLRRMSALRKNVRTTALKRLDDAPVAIVTGVAGVARSRLRGLSNELHALAQRLGRGDGKDSASAAQ